MNCMPASFAAYIYVFGARYSGTNGTSNLRTDFLCVKSSEDISGGCVFPNVPLYKTKTEQEFTYYFFYLIYLVLNKNTSGSLGKKSYTYTQYIDFM
jgi:hypothetical protein